MNLNINQDNVHLLIPGKISLIIEMYMEDKGVDVVDAIMALYRTQTYAKLEHEDTKFWHYGPVALYQHVLAEGDA